MHDPTNDPDTPAGEGDAAPVHTLDLHHRVQLGLVRAAEAQLRPDGDALAAGETVARLLDFTRVHFQGEETLMRLHRYPGTDAHVEAHAALLVEAVAISETHAAGDPARAQETCGKLRLWLLEHIGAMDAAFDQWCARNGVQLD
jgi:hemerythrin